MSCCKRWLVTSSSNTVLSLLRHKVIGGGKQTTVQFQWLHCFIYQWVECVRFSFLFFLPADKLSLCFVCNWVFTLTVRRHDMNFKLNFQRALQILWYWFVIDPHIDIWIQQSWAHLDSVFYFASIKELTALSGPILLPGRCKIIVLINCKIYSELWKLVKPRHH